MDETNSLLQTRSEVSESSKPRSWVVTLVWIGALSLLALLGLGLIRSQRGPVGIGDTVPDFKLSTFDGQEIDVLDLRGQVVVVNFWASWCSPCEQEALELEQAHRMYKDRGVVFLGVDYVDTEPEAKAYLEKFGITYANGPDLRTRISQAFRMRGVPETYVIDQEGTIVDVKIGPFVSLDEIVQTIEYALAQ